MRSDRSRVRPCHRVTRRAARGRSCSRGFRALATRNFPGHCAYGLLMARCRMCRFSPDRRMLRMLRRCAEKVPVCARVLRRIVVVVSLGFMSSVRIVAQAPATPEPPTEEAAAPAPPDTPVTMAPKSNVGRFIRTLGSDFAHLPTPWNAAILGMGGTLSIVAHNSDPGLNQRFERGKWIDALYETGSMFGDGYVQIGGAVLTYAVGVAYQSPKAKHIGGDLI